jgi:hypothetical protein
MIDHIVITKHKYSNISSINVFKKKLKQAKRLEVQITIGTFPWPHCTTCFG